MQKQADQTISKKDIAGVRIKYQVRYTVLIGLSKKKKRICFNSCIFDGLGYNNISKIHEDN